MKLIPLAYAAMIGAGVLSVASCSSSNSTPQEPESSIPDRYALQTALIKIFDPAATDPDEPSVTVEVMTGDDSEPVIALEAELDLDDECNGVGTYALHVTATNNADRPITNMKMIQDSGASILDVATISDWTGSVDNDSDQDGEDFAYFGEALVTPSGESRDLAYDPLCVNPNATTQSPLILSVELPTEDVGLIGASDYYGESEIISIDTNVGDYRVVGNTDAYEFYDEAAHPLEGVMSPDGRYTYMGHKSNPFIMILDNELGTVDAVALLDPPEDPYPSGWSTRIGSVDSVTMSPDGKFLYASVLDGMHPYDSSGCADSWADEAPVRNLMMKIDRESMELVGEVDVTPPTAQTCDDAGVLKRMSMSEDGSIGAVALFNRGRVILLDLSDMSVIKSMVLDGPANDKTEPHYTAVSPDGSQVYVAYNNNDDASLDVIDTDDFSISKLELKPSNDGPANSDDVGDLRFGPDGRLYLLRRDSGDHTIVIFSFSEDEEGEEVISQHVIGAEFMEGSSSYSYGRVAFSPYGDYWYYLDYNNDLWKFSMADDLLSPDSPIDTGGAEGHHAMIPTFQ